MDLDVKTILKVIILTGVGSIVLSWLLRRVRGVRLPQVESSSSIHVTPISANLKGTLMSTGRKKPEVCVYWGRGDGGEDPERWDHQRSLGRRKAGDFNWPISDLTPGETYHYTVSARNSRGQAWGRVRLFTTHIITPRIDILPAFDIADTKVTVDGEVLSRGGGARTVEIAVFYGARDEGKEPRAWNHYWYVGKVSSIGLLTMVLENLDPSTTYHCRLRAQNDAGEVWTPAISFTTLTA